MPAPVTTPADSVHSKMENQAGSYKQSEITRPHIKRLMDMVASGNCVFLEIKVFCGTLHHCLPKHFIFVLSCFA